MSGQVQLATRNRIVVFYSQLDSNQCHGVCSILIQQLLAAKHLAPGELNYTINSFDGWSLSIDGQEIRESLSHARVVVVLEGSNLMASPFVQAEEPPVKLLSEVRKHGAVTILRVSILPVQNRLIPAELGALQACGNYDHPISGFANAGQRELAIGVVVDEIAKAYQNWRPSISNDEFGDDPPVIVDRGNLVHPITIFPASIARWAKSEVGLAELTGVPGGGLWDNFCAWLEAQRPLVPPWILSLSPFPISLISPTLTEPCARLEQQAARLYPRHRDAYHCLHLILNDLNLSELSLSLAKHRLDEFDRFSRLSSQFQNSRERSLHFQHILVSLLRKHAGWWAAVEAIENELDSAQTEDESIKSYLLAWKCLPVCQLAILQRHQRCSSIGSVNASLSQCLILLDRMSHWLKATNRTMNTVEGVPSTPNIEEVELWAT